MGAAASGVLLVMLRQHTKEEFTPAAGISRRSGLLSSQTTRVEAGIYSLLPEFPAIAFGPVRMRCVSSRRNRRVSPARHAPSHGAVLAAAAAAGACSCEPHGVCVARSVWFRSVSLLSSACLRRRSSIVPTTGQLLIRINFERMRDVPGPFDVKIVYDRRNES
jgi:hypothetical protein